MKIESFKETLAIDKPDPQLSPMLKSLWYDAKGDWEKAHDLVDQLPGTDAARVHAYLHRKEGDTWNADYCYAKAKKTRTTISLEAEWESLASYFLVT